MVVKTTSNSRIRQRRSVLDTYPNLPGFIVEDLFLQNMKLINQGQYQCSVQEGGVPYLSGKIQLKLQGSSARTARPSGMFWRIAYCFILIVLFGITRILFTNNFAHTVKLSLN